MQVFHRKSRHLPLFRPCLFAILLTGMVSTLSAKNEPRGSVALGIQLPRGAVSVTVGNDRYYTHRGVYYRPGPRGYKVVPAPRGVVVRQLPRSSVRIVIGSRTYYRYEGVYYLPRENGYEVVPAPAEVSAIASSSAHAPVDEYESVWLDEQEYRFKNGQFFKPTPDGLVWVIAPTGAIIRELPEGAVVVWHDDIEYFDVDDVIFRKTPDGYRVVTPPWA